MVQRSSLHRSLSIIDKAKEAIFSQCNSAGVKRSAWLLFNHQLSRTDPETGNCYTPGKALKNTLCWMKQQAASLERSSLEPTQIQRQFLQMLVDGKTEKQTAYELKRNPRTMRVHLTKLRDRLGVTSFAQLIAIATKKRWVTVRMPKSKEA